MPHYTFDSDEDGTIRQILRDGQPHDGAVSLEQAFSVVTIYFQAAVQNIEAMASMSDRQALRIRGVQSFLMSITGLEAFTNTYFHLRAGELGHDGMLAKISQTHGSLTRKLVDLIGMTPDGPLVDQERLVDRLFGLCQLRNDIVHPRWEPSGLTINGDVSVNILGLVENPLAVFEDEAFCREALYWCLLAVARVGQTADSQTLDGFLFFWTGNYGLRLTDILAVLDLPADPH